MKGDQNNSKLILQDRDRVSAVLLRLRKIGGDERFRLQAKSYELLCYLVHQELAGLGEQINGYTIAQDVFRRGDEFDPTESSLVRVQMFRLRRLLEEYNRENDSPPQIAIPQRSYRPTFAFKSGKKGGAADKNESAESSEAQASASEQPQPGSGEQNAPKASKMADADRPKAAPPPSSIAIPTAASQQRDMSARPSAAEGAGARRKAELGAYAYARGDEPPARRSGPFAGRGQVEEMPAIPLPNSEHGVRGRGIFGCRMRRYSQILTMIVAATGVTIWSTSSSNADSQPVKQIAPSVVLEVPEDDPNAELLKDVRNSLLGELQAPTVLPVMFQKSGPAEYTVTIESDINIGDGVSMIVTAVRSNGEVVESRSFYDYDKNDLGKMNHMKKSIMKNFFEFDGVVPNDVRYYDEYKKTRKNLYGCYIDYVNYMSGRVVKYTTPKQMVECIRPEMVVDQREKAVLHLVRADLITLAASGDFDLGRRYTVGDAVGENQKSVQAYAMPNIQIEQMMFNEWNNPSRTDSSLRELIKKAKGLPKDNVTNFHIALTYVYYLDDMEAAQPYMKAMFDELEFNQSWGRNSWYMAKVPGALLSGEYNAAEEYLWLTETSHHPTTQMLDLVISCYQNKPWSVLDKKARSLQNYLEGRGITITEMIKGRRYSSRLERKLLDVFVTPQCRRYAGV